MTTRYFSSLIEQSLSRSTEATLSIMGVTNPQLREHLAQQMGADCGKPGSFLASPVFQQMFGWKESNHTMRSLTEGNALLSKAVVSTIALPSTLPSSRQNACKAMKRCSRTGN